MSDKAGNNLLIYFGLVCFVAAIFSFFLFDGGAQFQFLNELIEKNIRIVIVAVIGLTFTFFGIRGKMNARSGDKNNPS